MSEFSLNKPEILWFAEKKLNEAWVTFKNEYNLKLKGWTLKSFVTGLMSSDIPKAIIKLVTLLEGICVEIKAELVKLGDKNCDNKLSSTEKLDLVCKILDESIVCPLWLEAIDSYIWKGIIIVLVFAFNTFYGKSWLGKVTKVSF